MIQRRHILCCERSDSLENGCHVSPWILPKELDWTIHQKSFDLLGTTYDLAQVGHNENLTSNQQKCTQTMGVQDSPSHLPIPSSTSPSSSLIPYELEHHYKEDMKGKFIQLLRSTWLVFNYHPTTMKQGIVWLGSETVNRLLLIAEIFTLLDKKQGWPLRADQLWEHSVRTGCLAGRLSKEEGGDVDMMMQSCLAGFAHDIGLAIFAVSLDTSHYLEVLAHARRESTALATAELKILGMSHEIIGAELLERQRFPQSIVHAVSFHDNPLGLDHSGFTPTLAVFAANMLDGGGWPQDCDGVPSDRVVEYLSSRGFVNPWPRWQRHVKQRDRWECDCA